MCFNVDVDHHFDRICSKVSELKTKLSCCSLESEWNSNAAVEAELLRGLLL